MALVRRSFRGLPDPQSQTPAPCLMSSGKVALGPPRAVSWRVWPLVDGGWGARFWLAMLPIVLVVVHSATDSWFWAVAAVVALAAGCRRLFVPITYALNADGVEQRLWKRWRRIGWRRFQRWRVYPDGVLLSMSRETTAWEPLRELYLPLVDRRDRGIRDDALAMLEYRLGPPEQLPGFETRLSAAQQGRTSS